MRDKKNNPAIKGINRSTAVLGNIFRLNTHFQVASTHLCESRALHLWSHAAVIRCNCTITRWLWAHIDISVCYWRGQRHLCLECGTGVFHLMAVHPVWLKSGTRRYGRTCMLYIVSVWERQQRMSGGAFKTPQTFMPFWANACSVFTLCSNMHTNIT